jgi:hypothetical protein
MTTKKISKKASTKKSATSAPEGTESAPVSGEPGIDAQIGPDAPAEAQAAAPATVPHDGEAAQTGADGKEQAPREDLVVFAFRLTAQERDQIHKAAGPGKASKFVRALTTLAARGDVKTVSAMVEAVKRGGSTS